MSDILLESIRAAVLSGLVIFLLRASQTKRLGPNIGWNLIVGGFTLLLFGSILDITDNFENLNRYVVIGDTETEAFLEKFVGFLGGFVMVAVGLARWVPAMQRIQTEAAERKDAEETLLRSRDDLGNWIDDHLLSTILNDLPTPVLIKDLEGRYRMANRAFCKRYGISPSDIQGAMVEDVMSPEFANVSQAHDLQVLETMAPVIIQEKGVRPDGTECVEITAKSPLMDANACPVGILSVQTDITERNQAEEALHAADERNKMILNSAGEGIYGLDMEGRTTFVNPAVCEMLDYEMDELIGESMHPLIQHSYPDGTPYPREKCPMYAAFTDGEVHHVVDENLWRKDGTSFPVEYTSSPIHKDGKLTGAVVVFRDISERREIDRVKDTFVSMVSHELRTPLTSIIGALGMLHGNVAGDLPRQAESLITIAHENSTRLVRLINDLLDMEKIGTGNLELANRELELNALVGKSLETNGVYATQYGVTLSFEPHGAPAHVWADEDRLLQVMANLISNAVKFSPKSSTVRLSVTQQGENFKVLVGDSGPGVAKELQGQIFSKFFQADTGDTRSVEGTGLGLSISKAIVESLDGRIGVESAPGEGATFFFELPPYSKSETLETLGLSAPRRVLICENDVSSARVFKEFLEHNGFLADVTFTTAGISDMLAREQYSALLLSVTAWSGNKLPSLEDSTWMPGSNSLPIVMVSATSHLDQPAGAGDTDIPCIEWHGEASSGDELIDTLDQVISRSVEERPRVLHIEDDSDVVHVVQYMISSFAEVTAARTYENALKELADGNFDLVILDIGLPDEDGWELVNKINGQQDHPPVIVFSASEASKKRRDEVSAWLVKSRTTNAQVVDTVKAMVAG